MIEYLAAIPPDQLAMGGMILLVLGLLFVGWRFTN